MEKRANQIMSQKMVTVESDSSLVDAWVLMKKNRFRHLPVTDVSGRIVGILSDRDIQRSMKATGTLPTPTICSTEIDSKLKVRQFMAWPVLTVAEDEYIAAVAKMMLSEKISAFVVTSRAGEACGIVTSDDMLKLLVGILEKQPTEKKLSLMEIAENSLWI